MRPRRMIVGWLLLVILGGCRHPSAPAAAAGLTGGPPPKPLLALAARLPAGAQVVAYAPDLAKLVTRTRAAEGVKYFLGSPAGDRFRESRLYNKLTGRFEESAALLGPDLTLSDLAPLAGTESALALYDIGGLDFVYLTRMTEAALAATALAGARERADTGEVAGASYYRLAAAEGPGRLCFGMAGGFLVIAGDEARFREAFARVVSETPGGLAADAVFVRAFPADFALDDLVLFLDQKTLNTDQYFRRYWLYRNADDLGWIRSAVATIRLGPDFRERRYYASTGPAPEAINRELGPCLALVASDLFSECRGLASADQAAEAMAAMAEIAPGDTGDGSSDSSADSAADGAATVATTGAAGLAEALARALAPSQPVTMGSSNALSWSPDRLFFQLDRSLVIELAEPSRLDLDALRRVWAQALAVALGGPGSPAWKIARDDNGTAIVWPLLSGRLYLDLAGRFLVVSSDGPRHRRMLAAAEQVGGASWSGMENARWSLGRMQEELVPALELLGRYPDWPRAGSEAGVKYDLPGLARSLPPLIFLRETAVKGGMIVEESRLVEK